MHNPQFLYFYFVTGAEQHSDKIESNIKVNKTEEFIIEFLCAENIASIDIRHLLYIPFDGFIKFIEYQCSVEICCPESLFTLIPTLVKRNTLTSLMNF